jgi:translation initiation factor IF-3
LGEIDSYEALKLAREKSLDLILVQRACHPPVYKIGDLGKIRYELEKRQKESRKREPEIKTLKIRPNTHKHDLDIEIKKAREFLTRGDRVRLECRFRSREISFPDLGKANLEYIMAALADISKIEKNCELEMRIMLAILAPK